MRKADGRIKKKRYGACWRVTSRLVCLFMRLLRDFFGSSANILRELKTRKATPIFFPVWGKLKNVTLSQANNRLSKINSPQKAQGKLKNGVTSSLACLKLKRKNGVLLCTREGDVSPRITSNLTFLWKSYPCPASAADGTCTDLHFTLIALKPSKLSTFLEEYVWLHQY